MSSQYTDQQLKDAFKSIDTDNSGYIDRGEIRRLLVEKLKIDVKHADAMAADVMKDDPNNDGKITFPEFIAVMKSK